MVEKPAAHGEEQLLAPTRFTKEHGRDRVHVEEGAVISYQQERSIARRGLDVLEAVDIHDVVSGEMNPAGAEDALTPRPELLPCAAIHASDKAECESFERG